MRALLFISVLFLPACESEPDFDARFESAQEQMNETASEIEEELNRNRASKQSQSNSPPADDSLPAN